MHIGRQLIGGDGGATFLSEWMNRAADNAVFTVELINAINATLSVDVFHKNSEDTGPGSSAGTVASSVSTADLYPATIGPLKEMVRYQIVVTGDGSTGSVLYRMHPPTWFDTARA